MSTIAAMLMLAAAPAGGARMTAEQALAAHKVATSIGPDPCRDPSGDEIVVCGRRNSPYALPLHDPLAGSVESQSGGRRAQQMADVAESRTACARQSAFCYPPPAFNGGSVLRVLIKGVQALTDGE